MEKVFHNWLRLDLINLFAETPTKEFALRGFQDSMKDL
jgi:hypothetical protein